jgi:tetratricopeptide (TPR) repeat protein
MKRAIAVFFAALCAVAAVSAQSGLEEMLDRSDVLYEDGKHRESYELLQEARDQAAGSEELAAVLWRLSRQTLQLTDAEERDGASKETLLEGYEKGEELALQALELDPENHFAIYWKAANVGRWGQTKGILDSLFKAGPMREDLEKAVSIAPNHADSYYVLGALYAEVPGFISFGNIEYSVSYARKAIDARADEPMRASYYIQLAKSLWDRNWPARKRLNHAENTASKFRKADSPQERNKYYSSRFDFGQRRRYAPAGVKNLSDREEARQILRWLIDELEGRATLQEGEQADLQEAKELLNSW